MPDEPSKEKWRLDTPSGANLAAVERLDKTALGECRVVITLLPRGGKVTVFKDALPVLSLELPKGPMPSVVARQIVVRLLREMAEVCDDAGEYAV